MYFWKTHQDFILWCHLQLGAGNFHSTLFRKFLVNNIKSVFVTMLISHTHSWGLSDTEWFASLQSPLRNGNIFKAENSRDKGTTEVTHLDVDNESQIAYVRLGTWYLLLSNKEQSLGKGTGDRRGYNQRQKTAHPSFYPLLLSSRNCIHPTAPQLPSKSWPSYGMWPPVWEWL